MSIEQQTIDDLNTAKSNLLRALVEVTANPKPTYTTEEGRSISHDSHRESLLKQIAQIDELISQFEGPIFEVGEGVLM